MNKERTPIGMLPRVGLICAWLTPLVMSGCFVEVPMLPPWVVDSDPNTGSDTTGDTDTGSDTTGTNSIDTETDSCLPAGDWDSDELCDAADGCPYDSLKVLPGACGCGQYEPIFDTDSETFCDVTWPEPSCRDLTGVNWGDGCSIELLGAGRIGDACENIYGCTIPAGLALFSTKDECAWSCAGCSSNVDCATGEYCSHFSETQCGDFGFGECQPMSEFCINVTGQHWCGCDGENYPSECHLAQAGVALAYEGECADNCESDSDSDGICDSRDGCVGDANKTAPGACGCGVPDADTDSDFFPDCVVPMIVEDFENPADWPWGDWQQYSVSPLEDKLIGEAHDGLICLENPSQHTYTTTAIMFPMSSSVLSAWCMAGVTHDSSCGLGFAADADGAYRAVIDSSDNVLEFQRADVDGATVTVEVLAEVAVSLDHGQWYRIEALALSDGVYEARVYDADGVTPLASVQHTLGLLPLAGISVTGGIGRIDTIANYISDPAAGCVDVDSDGSCDADDLCRGDDGFGDADGDGRCDNADLCWGEDIVGDADTDGFCDEHRCPADLPLVYDPNVANHGWVASGICGQALTPLGAPVCTEAEWLSHVKAIEAVVLDYPWTATVYEDGNTGAGQQFYESPYTMMCTLESGEHPDIERLFEDLDACYQATSRWLLGLDAVIVDFSWGVNMDRVVKIYNERTAIFNGSCFADTLFSGDGREHGFHAVMEPAAEGWTYWTVVATDNCDLFGCGCDATLTGWSDPDGAFTEETLQNDSNLTGAPIGALQHCQDSRFSF